MIVNTEMHGGVAVITMDDGKANAVGHEMLDALEPALAKAAETAEAVVLAGRKGIFCGGFDLKTMQGGTPEDVDRLARRGGRMIQTLYGFPKPLVAAATGHGIALGALMLLACDTRVGARGDYRFGLNETAIGLELPVFGLALARDRLAPAEMTPAVIQARLYDAEGAVAAGYLDEAAEPDKVVQRAVEIAKGLGEMPSATYHATKINFRRDTMNTIAASLADKDA